MGALLETLPGGSTLPSDVKSQLNDKSVRRLEAIINSMTPEERRFPDIIKASRKRRIAMGSGTEIQEVNRLLKQFTQIQKVMKRMSRKGGLANLMRGLKGRLPPGAPF
jgi:signal recognition particle subunit SRP54